jgi:hypothetical protein
MNQPLLVLIKYWEFRRAGLSKDEAYAKARELA